MPNSTPAWEIPFADLGKVILALPEELIRIGKDIEEANKIIDEDLPQFVTLLSNASTVITDKFLNFQLDIAVAKEFMALLGELKAQVQGKSNVPAPAVTPAR